MKRRVAKKIFIYGCITWNVRLQTWERVLKKLYKDNESRQGYMNLMKSKSWTGKSIIDPSPFRGMKLSQIKRFYKAYDKSPKGIAEAKFQKELADAFDYDKTGGFI